jgi:hypothetical protein
MRLDILAIRDEGGQEGDCRQQGQGQEPFLHQGGPAADGLPPYITNGVSL